MRNDEFGSIMPDVNRTQLAQKVLRTQNINTPQFPGEQKGFSIEEIKRLIKRQKRAKGFTFNVAEDQTQNFNIDISGTARIYLGFTLQPFSQGAPINVWPEQFVLKINNEIIIDSVFPYMFSGAFMDDEYYFFPRPLSGTDSIDVTFGGAPQALDMHKIVYYV